MNERRWASGFACVANVIVLSFFVVWLFRLLRSRAQGIKSVPRRMRIQISRKRNDDEDATESFYSYVTAVDAPNGAKGLQTKVIEE